MNLSVKLPLYLSIAALLAGCNYSNQGLGSFSLAEDNMYNLSLLSPGMNEYEVYGIMKVPHSNHTLKVDQTTYDVWLYVTSATVLGQSRMVPQNLTPIVFKNGILEGWGYEYYRNVLKKAGCSRPEVSGFPFPWLPAFEELFVEEREGRGAWAMSKPPSDETPSAKSDGKRSPQKSPPAGANEGSTLKKPPQKSSSQSSTPREDEKKIDEAEEDDSDQNFNYW